LSSNAEADHPMRISVVTPSYNMAPYMEDTITSVIGNLRAGDEYFVVDGGSTDESIEVLRSYRDRFCWVSEPDRGQTNAINKVIDELPASVKYMAVVSAEGLTDKGDQTHFDTPSARELGRRYALAMQKLAQRF